MKRIAAALLLLITQAPLVSAHEGHSHEAAIETAPRGGTLRNADPFKAEAILNGDTVRIYVYDAALKPVKLDHAKAEGKVQLPRKKPKPVAFKKYGEFFEATIPGIGKVHRYDLHVNLEIGGTKALADFGIDNLQ